MSEKPQKRLVGWKEYLVGLISFGTARRAIILFRSARKVEQVALITRHNTGDLPAAETLVRPSVAPTSQQQAELLRAAQHGNETPAEELLRAVANGRQ